MLKKDYVLTYILDSLDAGKSLEELEQELKLSPLTLFVISKVHQTGEKWGVNLTLADILMIYKEGLTYSEIAYMKGLTPAGVRLFVRFHLTNHQVHMMLKKENKQGRHELKYRILAHTIYKDVEEMGMEKALERTTYTQGAFRRLYLEVKDWVEEQELQQLLYNDKNILEDYVISTDYVEEIKQSIEGGGSHE